MQRRTILVLAVTTILLPLLGACQISVYPQMVQPVAPALAAETQNTTSTTSDVYWAWDRHGTPVGTSTLVRSDAGLSAVLQTSELPAGQAKALWFAVYNNPQACKSSPCGDDDLFTPDAYADFLIVDVTDGQVIGRNGTGTFEGYLAVGDTSKSLFIEIGEPERAVGLLDPHNAEVHLWIHSKGPALYGEGLKEQLTTYMCEFLLGDGVAAEPGHVPATAGECACIQLSMHQ